MAEDLAPSEGARAGGGHRLATAIAVVTVGLLGGWLALLLGGRAIDRVGPFEIELFARPGSGVTEVALPPLGRVEADTHLPPLRLRATLRDIGAPALSTALEHRGVDGLTDAVQADLPRVLGLYVLRALLVVTLGGLLAGIVAFRPRWRLAALAGGTALLVFGASAGISWATYRSRAFTRPAFRGSLAIAPALLGPLQEASGRLAAFRDSLQRLVGGAVTTYRAIAGHEIPEAADVVVLHVSDIHLNPLGMDLAQRLAEAFDVDLVIDTGDLTSFGSPLEDPIVRRIPQIRVPYVFVPGNHDSQGTSAAVTRLPNAIVLDDDVRVVKGLRIYGVAHPVFSPGEGRGISDEAFEARVRAEGETVAERLSALGPPPDVLAVHDDRMAEASAGLVPVVLSGHFHVAAARSAGGTLFLRVGSTGAAGYNLVRHQEGVPLSAEILYFEGHPPRLAAFDLVEVNPVTQELTVRRVLAADVLEGTEPTPAPSG